MRDAEVEQSLEDLLVPRLESAREEVERIEQELSAMPRWRFRRRTDLEEIRRAARQREAGLSAALGESPNGNGRPD